MTCATSPLTLSLQQHKRSRSSAAPLKSFFRLPPQALPVPKFEFRPPQGSSEEVDLGRRARARGGGGGGGACEHGRCVHRRPPINMATRCLWSQCLFFQRPCLRSQVKRAPAHSSFKVLEMADATRRRHTRTAHFILVAIFSYGNASQGNTRGL
jgi:hypothetical protein